MQFIEKNCRIRTKTGKGFIANSERLFIISYLKCLNEPYLPQITHFQQNIRTETYLLTPIKGGALVLSDGFLRTMEYFP